MATEISTAAGGSASPWRWFSARRDPRRDQDDAGRRGLRGRQARRAGVHRRARRPQARGREGRQGLRRRAHRGDRPEASRQIDEIIHNPTFQKLESAWRGLKFVVDRTDFRENIKVELLNCSKEDLLADFEDSPEVPKSGLYKLVYSAEFGQFGGRPYGAIIANYEFGPGPQDIAAAAEVRARVATMAHAPFLAAAGPQFFGLEGLPEPAQPQGPQVALRGPAVHQVQLLPRDRGRALRRPRPAAVPPPAAVRLQHGPGQALQLRRGRHRQARRLLLGQRRVRVRHAPRRQLRQVPLVPEHHRPPGRRQRREPAAAPVRGDGRGADQDPHRDHAHGAPRVRAVGGGLHRPDLPQGLRQRLLLLRQLACRSPSTSARARRAAPPR